MVQKLSGYHVNTPWNFTVHARLHAYMYLYKWKSVIVSFLCLYNIYTILHVITFLRSMKSLNIQPIKLSSVALDTSDLHWTIQAITGAGKPMQWKL